MNSAADAGDYGGGGGKSSAAASAGGVRSRGATWLKASEKDSYGNYKSRDAFGA
jgi:hypothetical protein